MVNTGLMDFAEITSRLADVRKGTADYIVDYLREQIITGLILPGTHIVESQVAQALSVSKTPVREALKRLPETGLVESFPYRGTFVREMNPTFVHEVVTLRSHFEILAVELALIKFKETDFSRMEQIAQEMEALTRVGNHLATVKLDAEFHSLFYERAEHALLKEMWERILPRVEMIQAYGRISASPLPEGHVVKRHLDLVKALRSRDVERAQEAVKNHIRLGEHLIFNKSA